MHSALVSPMDCPPERSEGTQHPSIEMLHSVQHDTIPCFCRFQNNVLLSMMSFRAQFILSAAKNLIFSSEHDILFKIDLIFS